MRKLAWIIFAISMASCGGGNQEGDKKLEPQSAEARQAEILEKETILKGNHDFTSQATKARADELVKLYQNYISMNPTDSISAEYLFKGADLYIGLENYKASIALIDRLITSFPNYPKIVEIMLFKGFIYENYMNSHAEAVKAYQALIDKYPNHRLAQDAKSAIENLTMSEDELMEKFKKMNEKPAA